MIAVAIFSVECAWQGGLRMSPPPPPSERQISPAQVWPALSRDLRTRVSGLLAQLVLNMVARHGNECEGLEEANDEPTIVAENPS